MTTAPCRRGSQPELIYVVESIIERRRASSASIRRNCAAATPSRRARYDTRADLIRYRYGDSDLVTMHADDFCRFELEENSSPTDKNPLGVKGVGEAGTIGAIPAVMNAINNALAAIGAPPVELPATPEKVWRALRAAA
jgi:hypothetical protein